MSPEVGVEVTQIDWSSTGAIVSGADRTIEADAVVVSVPLGVLKAGAIRFRPSLPDDFQRSVDALDMADLRKVVFGYDDVHWPDEKYWLYHSDPPGDFPLIVDFTPIRGAPVLELEYSGHAPSAGRPPAEIAERALNVLRTVFGDALPDPIDVAHSEWHTDPFSRGSYSYMPVGSRASDMDRLAEPVGPVHFVGEATYPEFYGTVHAAYLSGRRAAAAIDGAATQVSFATANDEAAIRRR